LDPKLMTNILNKLAHQL